MRPGAVRLAAQRVALLHAEPVLLVDHDQAEVGELHLLGEQRMGADDDPGRAGRRVKQRLAARGGGLGAGEQGHPGRHLRAAEPACLAERAEEVRHRPVVLLRENLGRGEQRGLPAGVDDLEHGPHRDHGLARAHLALQQPVHGVVAGQVGGDFGADVALARGERERQPGVEGAGQAARARGARRGGQRGRGQAALGQDGLEHQRLVPLQPDPGAFLFGVIRGPVHAAQGIGEPGQAVPLAQRRRQRVVELAQGVKDDLHALLDVPGGHVLGGRVHRDQFGGVLGRLGRVVGAEELELRVRELALALEGGHPPGEHGVPPGSELALPVLHLVEERQRQPGPPVGDRDLEQLAAPGPHGPGPDLLHLREDRDLLAVPQRGQVGELAAAAVPARIVPQQVPRGGQAERRVQLGRCLPAEGGSQRFLQACHGPSE